MKKLDKKTLKWAAKRIEQWGDVADKASPVYYWDAAHRPTESERTGRVLMLRALAKEIKCGDK